MPGPLVALTAAPAIVGGAIELGRELINRFFPDKTEAAKAEAELALLLAKGELNVVMEQLRINAAEAAHPSVFVSGGRPFVMWVCGFGFAYATIVHPFLTWLATAKGWPLPPTLDNELLSTTLWALLGLGGLRSVEKIKRVASK